MIRFLALLLVVIGLMILIYSWCSIVHGIPVIETGGNSGRETLMDVKSVSLASPEPFTPQASGNVSQAVAEPQTPQPEAREGYPQQALKRARIRGGLCLPQAWLGHESPEITLVPLGADVVVDGGWKKLKPRQITVTKPPGISRWDAGSLVPVEYEARVKPSGYRQGLVALVDSDLPHELVVPGGDSYVAPAWRE